MGDRRATVHRSRLHRLSIAAFGLILAATTVAAPVLAGDTRAVTVGSGADGDLPTISVSVGESITFPVTVANTGKQTLNNVQLSIGRDSNLDDETTGPEIPTQPTGLPGGTTISASGCTATEGVLHCPIGSLRSRPVTFSVTIASGSASAQVVPLKAVVTVAEIGNDQGANTDTFAAEGTLTLLAADCNAISAQRTGSESNIVSTCGVTAAGAGGVSASIKLPAGRSYVSLSDNNPCTGCYGREIIADIADDAPSDVVVWVIEIDVTGLGTINLQKLVAVHTNDAGTDTTTIPLTKRNECKTATSTDCGTALIRTEAGRTILQITIQTPGNGKTRIL
jgi:hypothetical protein